MSAPSTPFSLTRLLLCGGAIVTLSMGIRHGFGMWLQPVIQSHGWGREDFALAIAIQNLAWGLSGIFVGMAADRFGAVRVVLVGALTYTLGLLGMAYSPTPLTFILSTGVLIGIAQAGTTYAVIYGVIGRNVPAERRAWAMGITAAAGSFGQFLMVPTESFLIGQLGWQQALVVLGVAALLMLPLTVGLREPGLRGGALPRHQSVRQAFVEACRYPSFQWLMAGYFVCGFQVVFIGVHLPAYLKDKGLEPQVAGYALALVGLFNVFGTYAAGVLGQKLAKRKILTTIYLSRSVAITLFLIAPLSPTTVYLFAGAIGFLWLSTVPVTNATVAQIFGVSHLSMLSGFVFFGHQVGSFLGAWLGGYLFDKTGSYDVVWYIAIALGVLAALANLPIRETAIVRSPDAAAAA